MFGVLFEGDMAPGDLQMSIAVTLHSPTECSDLDTAWQAGEEANDTVQLQPRPGVE